MATLIADARKQKIQIIKQMEKVETVLLKKYQVSQDTFDAPIVDIDTFIDSPEYLGSTTDGGKLVYPYWRETLHKVFEPGSNIIEVILTGPIGAGKSTCAKIGILYDLHRTLCLLDPHGYYNMIRSQDIVFLLFTLTKELAQSGLYQELNDWMMASPWFTKRGAIRGKDNKWVDFGKKHTTITQGTVLSKAGYVGRNVMSGILDEVSEHKVQGKLYANQNRSKILESYTAVRRRMESRFMQAGGGLPGHLWLISSAQEEHAFLEQYVDTVKGQDDVLIKADPIWVIKPPTDQHGNPRYTGVMFKVAVGDKNKRSAVIHVDSEVEFYEKHHYKIMEVPEEYREVFERDVEGALRDIAGIASVSSSKLIPYPERVDACFKSRPNPFPDTIEMGLMEANYPIQSIITEDMKQKLRAAGKGLPRFLHVDIGLTGDALGLGSVYSPGLTNIKRYSDDGVYLTQDMLFEADFLLRVKASQGDEIPLNRVREFIVWCHDELGWPIEKITFDRFNSADSIQILKSQGFECELLSVDRDDSAYLVGKSAILEGRLDCPNVTTCPQELKDLLHDREARKVDHPADGSKDVADGLIGAMFSCSTSTVNDVAQDIRSGRASEVVSEIVKTMADPTGDLEGFYKGLGQMPGDDLRIIRVRGPKEEEQEGPIKERPRSLKGIPDRGYGDF